MLTPLDIENKKFSKQMMNGYNVEEIDDFLDQITLDYEKLYREVSDLKARINEMEDSVSHYKTIENTLQNTLVMAQTTADEIKRVATQQAEQIVRDAEFSAKEAVATLKTERIEENKRMQEIKKQFEVYKAKMEALLISQLELLKDSSADYEVHDYDDNSFENTFDMPETQPYTEKQEFTDYSNNDYTNMYTDMNQNNSEEEKEEEETFTGFGQFDYIPESRGGMDNMFDNDFKIDLPKDE